MWQSVYGAGWSSDCSASFIHGQASEICMTLFRSVGTIGSLLLLLIIVTLILGVPIVLLVIRLIEIISEMRHESSRRSNAQSATEEESVGDSADWGPVKHRREEESTKDSGEWTPAKHMR